ncbi:conserved hypothetical protein [Neospora caninum Liverpool]|uniref:Uncharacterized protein n=1 Tax=Neospora caninum (strain Liverpool) TaxID=572307 RepID=F0V9A0_NEOCL|nr:conserved hypothetical protein [Neospora caninum Liverpool]CBZ50325.1 conserved hypothetical protein [Neospora caninum Liverpool]CEL64931.1 TPA: hypothetical protein BN1204_007980 [Neospora caninum Liverpool]|eukprot:XP_003880359.1 conserved hypothetical protein [Neospora caninum Liverpool]
MGRLSRLLTFGLRKSPPHLSTSSTDAVSPSQFHSSFIPTSPYSRRFSPPSPHPSLSPPTATAAPPPPSPLGSSPPPARRSSTSRSPFGRASSASPSGSKSPFGARQFASRRVTGEEAKASDSRRGRFRYPSAPPTSHSPPGSRGAALPVGGAAAGAIRRSAGAAGAARLTSSIPLKPKSLFGRRGSGAASVSPTRGLWARRDTITAQSQHALERPGAVLERVPLREEPPAPKAEPVVKGRSGTGGLGIERRTTLPPERGGPDDRIQRKSVSFQKPASRSRSLFAWARRASGNKTSTLFPAQRKTGQQTVEREASGRDDVHRFLSRDLQSFGRPGERRGSEANRGWREEKNSLSRAATARGGTGDGEPGNASHVFVHASEARMRSVYLDKQGTKVVVEQRQQATFARRASTERSNSFSSPSPAFPSASTSPVSRFPPSDPPFPPSQASRPRGPSFSSSARFPGLSEPASGLLPSSADPASSEDAPARGRSSSGSFSWNGTPAAHGQAPASQTADEHAGVKRSKKRGLTKGSSFASSFASSSSPFFHHEPVSGRLDSKRGSPLPTSPPWSDGSRGSPEMTPASTEPPASSVSRRKFAASRSSSSLGFGKLLGNLSSSFSRRRNSTSSKSSASPSVAASGSVGSAATAGGSRPDAPGWGTKARGAKTETRARPSPPYEAGPGRNGGPTEGTDRERVAGGGAREQVLSCYSFRASQAENERMSAGGEPPLSSVLSLDSDTASLLSCHSLSSRSVSAKLDSKARPRGSAASPAEGAQRAEPKCKEAVPAAHRRFDACAAHQTPGRAEASLASSASGAPAPGKKPPGADQAAASVGRRSASAAPGKSGHSFSEPQMPPPKVRRSGPGSSFEAPAGAADSSSERLWQQTGGQALREVAHESNDAKRELEIFASEFLLTEDEEQPREALPTRYTEYSNLPGPDGSPVYERRATGDVARHHRSLSRKARDRGDLEHEEAREAARKKRSPSGTTPRRGRTRGEVRLRSSSKRKSSVVAVRDGRLVSSAGAAKAAADEEAYEKVVRPRGGSGHRRSTDEGTAHRRRSRRKSSTADLSRHGSGGLRHVESRRHGHHGSHVLRTETSPAGFAHQTSSVDYEVSRPPDLSLRLRRHRTLQSPLLHLPSSPSFPALPADSMQSSWSVGGDGGRRGRAGQEPPLGEGLRPKLDDAERAELRRELAELEARERHLEKLRKDLKRAESRLARAGESQARPSRQGTEDVRKEARRLREDSRVFTRQRDLQTQLDDRGVLSLSSDDGADLPSSVSAQASLSEGERRQAEWEDRVREIDDTDVPLPYPRRTGFAYEASHGALPCWSRLSSHNADGVEEGKEFCHPAPPRLLVSESWRGAPPPPEVFETSNDSWESPVRRRPGPGASATVAMLSGLARCRSVRIRTQTRGECVSPPGARVRTVRDEAPAQGDLRPSSSCSSLPGCIREETVGTDAPNPFFRVEMRHSLFSTFRASAICSPSAHGGLAAGTSLVVDSDEDDSGIPGFLSGTSSETLSKISCIDASFADSDDAREAPCVPQPSTASVPSRKKTLLPPGFFGQRSKRLTVAASPALPTIQSRASRRLVAFGAGTLFPSGSACGVFEVPVNGPCRQSSEETERTCTATDSMSEVEREEREDGRVCRLAPLPLPATEAELEHALTLAVSEGPYETMVGLVSSTEAELDEQRLDQENTPLRTCIRRVPVSAFAGRGRPRKNVRLCVRFAAEIEELLRIKEEEEEARKALEGGAETPAAAKDSNDFDWNQTWNGGSTASKQSGQVDGSSEPRRMTLCQRLGSGGSLKAFVTRLRAAPQGPSQGKQERMDTEASSESALGQLRQQFAAAVRFNAARGVSSSPDSPRQTDGEADRDASDTSDSRNLHRAQRGAADTAGGVLAAFRLGRRSGEGTDGWESSRDANRKKTERRAFWLKGRLLSKRDA